MQGTPSAFQKMNSETWLIWMSLCIPSYFSVVLEAHWDQLFTDVSKYCIVFDWLATYA